MDCQHALEAENETIQQQLAELNYTRQINELDANPFDLLIDMAKSFAVTVDHMTFEQKKNYRCTPVSYRYGG